MQKIHRRASSVNFSLAQRSAIAHQEAMRILTKGSRLVYDFLHGWTSDQRRTGDKRGCFPSRKYIALRTRVSISTVQRAFQQFRETGLLKVTKRHTHHKLWERIHKQMTNLIELPDRDSFEKFISGLVSPKLRKKRGSNRRKQKVEGSIEGRRDRLRAQYQSILAAEQKQNGG